MRSSSPSKLRVMGGLEMVLAPSLAEEALAEQVALALAGLEGKEWLTALLRLEGEAVGRVPWGQEAEELWRSWGEAGRPPIPCP